MEPNLAVISKKVWNTVRVAIFMIRKGLWKKKIFMDLNMIMKRGKIAGKAALGNLMFHHHHNHHHVSASKGGVGGPTFNRPKFTKKRKNYHHHQDSDQFYTPLPYFMQDGEKVNLADVSNMIEMMLCNEEATTNAGGSTPWPAFTGRSPAVRQLRITDSPFPVQDSEDTKYVDQAAEDFIKRFHSRIQKQADYC